VPSPYDLTAGQPLEPATFTISQREARQYIEAVGDASARYHNPDAPLPPMLLAARGLQVLMAQVEIPGGTVHGGQECEFFRQSYPGEELRLTASVPRAASRQGQRFVTLELAIFADDAPVCRCRSLLIMPSADPRVEV
jgi:acyl dehydratase